jgi:ATP-dependent protease ClpP protease subunit
MGKEHFMRFSFERISILAVVLAMSLSTFTWADQIMLKDGRVIEGRVLQQTSKDVRIEVKKGSSVLVAQYPRALIDKVVISQPPKSPSGATTKPAETVAPVSPTVPSSQPESSRPGTYMVAPIRGMFGLYVTAPLLQKYFDQARREKVQLLIFDIDSGGGVVHELEEMLKLLEKQKDLKIAAYVRQAHSCAALFAMSCPTVVMAPEATIGGAVIFRHTPWGTPENIEEKMQSVLHAKFRASVEEAGHSPLLVEAMMRADIAVGRVGTGASAKVIEPGTGTLDDFVMIKPGGKILTLTAREALDCGLAAEISSDTSACATRVGLTGLVENSSNAVRANKEYRESIDNAAKGYHRVLKRAKEAYDGAVTVHPRGHSYLAERDSGKFVGKAAKDWRKRSDECVRFLERYRVAIQAARRVVEINPYIAYHPSLEGNVFAPATLQALANDVAKVKRDVYADRKRQGVSDPERLPE